MNILKIATEIMHEAHKGQTRRDKVTPYVNHPIEVARIVNEILGFGQEYQAVALLHDVLEDNKKYTYDLLIDKGIPAQYADAVLLLTKQKDQSYEKYLELVNSNHISKVVKTADIIANLTDSPTEKQIKKYLPALKSLIN